MSQETLAILEEGRRRERLQILLYRGLVRQADEAGREADAERAVTYLRQNAPRDPLAGTYYAGQPAIPEQERMDWTRRVAVFEDPFTAMDRVMSGGQMTALEAEALRAMWPSLWNAGREALSARAQELITTLPQERLERIGQSFALPLTIALADQYPITGGIPAAGQGRAAPAPDARFGGPTSVNASPLVDYQQTDDDALRARRRL